MGAGLQLHIITLSLQADLCQRTPGSPEFCPPLGAESQESQGSCSGWLAVPSPKRRREEKQEKTPAAPCPSAG